MEDSTVTYEQLNDLSAEFDDAETELMRQDVLVKQPLYKKRHELVAQIPNFWPLVFEQAPPDIDEFIQPSDSALLLTSLTSFSVSHFEVEEGSQGDPRSLAFRFEFNDNDHFEDRVIEKKFWQRRSKGGWSGLVSEPVEIRWKAGKDLTGGLLGMVKKVWDARQSRPQEEGSKVKELTADERALKRKIENTGLGGMSFFAWLGYVGHNVSAEESRQATEEARQERLARQAGTAPSNGEDKDEEEDDDDDEDDENGLEIFPDGENLAIALSEDLWPSAIKYFTTAQEQDEASDDDFESDAGDEKDEEEAAYSDQEPPPAKRVKKG
ncbi:unnamed protein product [Discula destructiva]